MGDLRERLAASLAEPGRCEHPGGDSFDQWWRADAALGVVVAWLRDEVTGDAFAEATEQHHIVNDRTDANGNSPCICDQWWDSADCPGWDQHMAYVGLRALADSVATPELEPAETVALEAVVPVSNEVAADAAAMKTAWEKFWNVTPEQRAQWQAEAAERRAFERASAAVQLFDMGCLDILLDRLEISRELAAHMVQPYCTCSIGYDGLDVCQHARDLGLGS